MADSRTPLLSLDPVSAEEALNLVGSRGRFQFLAAITMILSFTLNGHIMFGLSYLIYKGDLDLTCHPVSASESPKSCNWEVACDSSITKSYDINDGSLINWITNFNLVCTPESELSFLGMTYFICFTVGSLLFLWLADKFGRKPLIFYGLIFHAIIMVMVLLISWTNFVYVFCGLHGIQVATTCLVAYVLLLEVVPT